MKGSIPLTLVDHPHQDVLVLQNKHNNIFIGSGNSATQKDGVSAILMPAHGGLLAIELYSPGPSSSFR